MLRIEDLRFSSSSIDDFMGDSDRVRTAGSKMRVSSAEDLAGFSLISSDQLIHLSRQDFWKLGKDQEGYFIERLVNDDNGPVEG